MSLLDYRHRVFVVTPKYIIQPLCVSVCVISQIQGTKAELNGLGDSIEEVRSVCRQLHAHLRLIPECTIIPFESEADTLMDSWLDVSLDALKTQLNHCC